MGLRIATWNINSVRLRIENVVRFLVETAPDVLCLQETKTPDADFPLEALSRLGYRHTLIRGMKGYNGVSVISRVPLKRRTHRDWCDRQDCRHIVAGLPGGIELHNFYVPAGGDVPDPKANPKFAHKLNFLAEMADWLARERGRRTRMILVGDLNVAPLEMDVWSHRQLLDVVSHTPIEVEHLGRVQRANRWVDAVRHFVPPTERLYSWWSYRARDWEASDRGRRLDHVWVTPALVPALRKAEVMRATRGWSLASDHVPVIVDIG